MASILENHHIMKQEGMGAWRCVGAWRCGWIEKKAKDEPRAAVHK